MSGFDDIWQPKTKTEHMIFQYFTDLAPRSNELKEIETAYRNYKEFSFIRGSDLDLELLLEYIRPIVEVFEEKAEEPGEYQVFCQGIMDACYGFLRQMICMHEAKSKLKRDALDEAKWEARYLEGKANRYDHM